MGVSFEIPIISLLLVSVYLVLCGSPQSTWTWTLYKEIRIDWCSFFYMLLVEQAFVENTVFFFPPLDGFSCFVKDQVGVCGFISGLSILFHWSTCLSLYQYHAVFITIALWYSLNSGMVIPSEILLLLGIAFTIIGFVLFCFCYSW